MTHILLISALAAGVFLAFIVIKIGIYASRVERLEQVRQPDSKPPSRNESPTHYPDISSFPRWSVYLAASGVFASLTALFALLAMPKSDPASIGENVVWGLFIVGLIAVVPLVCFRLRQILYSLGDLPYESNQGFNKSPESSGPAKPSKRDGGAS
jgi:hypothetical protein